MSKGKIRIKVWRKPESCSVSLQSTVRILGGGSSEGCDAVERLRILIP